MTRPVGKKVARLRQRERSDGTWRIWWEPEASVRLLGFQSVELDADRPTWSAREAEKLNREVVRIRAGGEPHAPRVTGRTIEDLIEDYRRSRKFRALKPATQVSYAANFRLILAKWGSRAVADFTKPVMYAWHETLADNAGHSQAVALIRSMSILFSHAEMIGWRAEGSNPCSRLGMKTPAPRAGTFTWDQLDLMVAVADRLGLAATGTAILLSALQGQRQTDVISARAAAFRLARIVDPDTEAETRVWVWEFVRSKRGNTGAMEVHPDVLPRLRALLARNDGREVLLIDELGGLPFTTFSIGDRFDRVRAEAARTDPAIADLQFRDLRRSFGALARAGGATKDDVGDVLGNSAATNPRLGETYMAPSFFTASRAVRAIRRPAAPDRKRKA